MEIEKLRLLTNDLLDELLAVWEKAVRSSHHFLQEEDIEYFKPLVRNTYLSSVDVFVVRYGCGRIGAFMGVSDDMLEMLFVLPERQGKGYGKALVDFAVNECGKLKVDVNEENEKAYGFYLKMGYEIIGRDEYDSTGKHFPVVHLQYKATNTP